MACLRGWRRRGGVGTRSIGLTCLGVGSAAGVTLRGDGSEGGGLGGVEGTTLSGEGVVVGRVTGEGVGGVLGGVG